MWDSDGLLRAAGIGRHQPPIWVDPGTRTIWRGKSWQKTSAPADQVQVWMRQPTIETRRGWFGRPSRRWVRAQLVVTGPGGLDWRAVVRDSSAASRFVAEWDAWRRAGMPARPRS